MPVVKKINPLADAIPESEPQTDPTLDVLVSKIEEIYARLNSFREPMLALDNVIKTAQALDERVEELEKAALGTEMGKSPVLPEQVYAGLTPSAIFQASLGGIFTAAFTTFPSMLGAKPELQATHIRRVIDLAYRCTLVACERLPKLVEAGNGR